MLPEPFTMLDDRERRVLLDRWMRLLNASRRLRVSFYLLSEQVMGFSFTRYGFYVESPVDPSSFGFRAEPATEPPRPRPVERRPGAVRLEDGSWAKVYVVYNLPAMLPEAAITAFYGIADEVHLFLEQLSPREARRRLKGWRARLEAVLADDPSNIEVRRRLEKLAELETMLMGYSRLFQADGPAGR